MNAVYPKGVEGTPVDPGRPPLAVRKGIETIKAEVDILTVAQGYGQLRPVGAGRFEGRCLAPDHEDRTPSMSVKLDTQTFRCFGCGAHGDVIDLVRMVEGGETWEAMMSLSLRFGVELPSRPEGWFRKQQRQRPVRDAIDADRIEHIRHLIFRLVEAPYLKRMPEWEREEATARAWRETLPKARMLYESRRGA